MSSDIFGNLKEWGSVLDVLDSLRESRKLDNHQSGLARILRYAENWRLMERVLEYGKEITQPADEFLLEVTNIMTNRNIYLDARILAVNTLEYLFPRTNCQTFIVQKMNDILNSPEPPIFHEAVKESLNSIMGMGK